MPSVKQVVEYIEKIAPPQLAEDWDNIGLLVDAGDCADRILVALDITPQVVQEAKQLGCGLIVAHHPVIFEPVRRLGRRDVPFLLAAAGISALCVHTNLDAAEGGVNEVLAGVLGLEDVQQLADFGRIGRLEREMSPTEFAQLCAQRLGTQVELADAASGVRRVALVGGAGGSVWRDALAAQADCFVTGEAKHHELLEALAAGMSLVVAGHYATEHPVVEVLAQMLRRRFGEAEVFVAQSDTAPTVFVGG